VWTIHLPGVTLAELKKLKVPAEIEAGPAREQAKLAKQLAVRIAGSGHAGTPERFDVSIDCRCPAGEAENEAPAAITVSVAADLVHVDA